MRDKTTTREENKMTIRFETLWAIWLGTLIGAVIMHVVFGRTEGYMHSIYCAIFIGIAHLVKARGWTHESSEETLIAVQAGSKYVTINGKPAHPPGMHEVFKYCKTCDDIRNKS